MVLGMRTLYTAQLLNAQNKVFQMNQLRMGLANNPLSHSIQDVFQADKHATLASAQASINASALEHMIESAKKIEEKNIKSTFNTFA